MIPAGVRIFVCADPVDLRKSFDGLTGAARERLGLDPVAGGLFVFANKRFNRVKVLWVERNGSCVLYKRLHQALVRLPPRSAEASAIQIGSAELARILEGVPKIARQKSAGINRSAH